MTTLTWLIRSLGFHWRSHLAVLLGVLAGTAVIGGALVVGDSVRDSLRQMTLERLGRIDLVVHGPRFFREELAAELQQHPEFSAALSEAAPALFLVGSLEHRTDSATLRAGGVNVLGVDERFWRLSHHGGAPPPADRTAVLNGRVAEQLNVRVGDEVSLWVELPPAIPRESLLGKREEVSREIVLTVGGILEEAVGVSRFELNPNQQLPLNAFVHLQTLQRNLDLAAVPASRRNPVAAPARVNALCVAARGPMDAAAARLEGLLAARLSLADLQLRLVSNAPRGYVALESEQMILEDAFVEAAERAVRQLSDEAAAGPMPTLRKVQVYLANEIAHAREAERFSMYAVIAGLEGPCTVSGARADGSRDSLGVEMDCAPAPFDDFTFLAGPLPQDVHSPPGGQRAGYIVLNEWLAEDLGAAPGDDVRVRYHVVGSHGELPEEERLFRVWGVAAMSGPAADRGLTPELKGITDADTFAEWDQPFPMKLDRVTRRDDEYWERYRATPKAFVPLHTAQELWRSRYGQLTSLQIGALPGRDVEQTAAAFSAAFLRAVRPSDVGLAARPVKQEGLQAADGTTNFSMLFLLFSFFLILSATILIALLFRLGIERRTSEIGLLVAVGFSPARVRRLFFAEALLVVCAGGLFGTAAAAGYARLIIAALTSERWWLGAIGTKFLAVSLHPGSLAIGFAATVGIMALAVGWSLRRLRGFSARELLSGTTSHALSAGAQRRRSRRAAALAATFAGLALALIAAVSTGLIPAGEAGMGITWTMVSFFIGGVALLAAGLAGLAAWLDSDRSVAIRGGGIAGMGRLGLRNAARHRQRSVFTVGLIASATFVIVAVAAGHRNPARETPVKDSGNGGFLLVAESSQPILFDLNSPDGRAKLDLRGLEPADGALLEAMRVVPFRVQPGEEASCLNIYQTRLPTLLGVPQRMIDRGGFRFAGTPGENPWTLLTEPRRPLDFRGRHLPVVPVLGDMNSLQYSLKKRIGDVIAVPNEENAQFLLQIAGMFDGSVFQGVLLMSEANFVRWFPQRAGYQYFLIGDGRFEDGKTALSPEQAARLSDLLETQLAPLGFDAQPVAKRLQEFLAVQNTYLSTFQALGGLGLILGTLGLSTVMLRNVLERRGELALLRAVGFVNRQLAWLIVWENAFLLVWGLAAGTAAALLAMTPHLLSIGADVPWGGVAAILAGVLVVGMAAAVLAVREAIRTPILETLRSE